MSNVVYWHANLIICVYDWDARVTISQQNCRCRTARATAQNSKRVLRAFAQRCTLFHNSDFSYKLRFFDQSKINLKVEEFSPILQKLLIYIGYQLSMSLNPKFSPLQKIWDFKPRELYFYLIKQLICCTFKIEAS